MTRFSMDELHRLAENGEVGLAAVDGRDAPFACLLGRGELEGGKRRQWQGRPAEEGRRRGLVLK